MVYQDAYYGFVRSVTAPLGGRAARPGTGMHTVNSAALLLACSSQAQAGMLRRVIGKATVSADQTEKWRYTITDLYNIWVRRGKLIRSISDCMLIVVL